MLGMRLIWPDIRPTCACATFCFHVHYFDASTGTRINRKKKKIALGLALAVMLTLARFHDMYCFTCTHAYIRACVTSENKAFMLLPLPCFYASLRIFMLALFMSKRKSAIIMKIC